MNNCKHSGFIAVVGKPNVGKSTLVNRFVGEKIAIVSRKPQTTRTRIMAVLSEEDSQLVFMDTPGFHRPKTALGSYMMGVVKNTIGEVDAVLLLVEPYLPIAPENLQIIEAAKQKRLPLVLGINKIDMVPKEGLLELIERYSALHDFKALVPISAQKGAGCVDLLNELRALLPPGPAYFPEDQLSDQPERVLVSERIREKLLRRLQEEVPHGTAVEVLGMKEKKEGELLAIDAVIYCEKSSHKGILIGKNGAMLKQIGSEARADLERFFGVQVHLSLWVKVKDDWRNNQHLLKEFGFHD